MTWVSLRVLWPVFCALLCTPVRATARVGRPAPKDTSRTSRRHVPRWQPTDVKFTFTRLPSGTPAGLSEVAVYGMGDATQ